MTVEVEREMPSERAEAIFPDCRLAPGLRQSCLAPNLIAAYRSTSYIVDQVPPLALRIGERSDRLHAMMVEKGTSHALFITAFNPYGRVLSHAVNAERADGYCQSNVAALARR